MKFIIAFDSLEDMQFAAAALNNRDIHLQATVSDSGMSVRAKEILLGLGIERASQLLGMTESQLLRTPNLGRKSMTEINLWLSSLGLTLLRPK